MDELSAIRVGVKRKKLSDALMTGPRKKVNLSDAPEVLIDLDDLGLTPEAKEQVLFLLTTFRGKIIAVGKEWPKI